ncbi:MAG: acetyltransferase [Gammaproteobacteria bacterium]|nr:acetyltransferase [Gammaproteobacteria bacterium]
MPAEKKFEPILLTWFDKPHVQEFYYGDGLKSTLHNIKLYMQGIKNNGDYSFDHWIAFFDNQPFGFLMTSTIENGHEYFMKDASTMTLDLLIGEEAFLGKGLAVAMTQELILDKFSDTDYVLIDPSASNPKAIHVYEKAGFKKIADFIPSYDPIPHLMMRLTVQDLKNQISREHKNF